MTRYSIQILGVLALATSAGAQAAVTLTEWGSLATLSTFTCANERCNPLDDFLGFTNTLTVNPIDGGVGQTSANVSVGSWPTPGSASGSATVSSGFGIPILKAGATGESNTWHGGQALAIQAYAYSGAGETVSLNWDLTGNITNPDGDGVTGLVVLASFVAANALPAFPDVTQPLSAYTLLESLATPGPTTNLLEFTADGAVHETGTIQIDVANGEQFYLVMGLMAGAGGSGAIAESLSTFDASFVGSPALSPAFAAVPLPAAVWMFGSALFGIISARRRVLL